MKKLPLFLIFTIISLQVFSQQKKWVKAQTKNTIEEYKKFLAKYPNSLPYSSQARGQLVLLEATKALKGNNVSSYDYFIKNYSKPEYKEATKDWLINIEFYRAMMLADTIEYGIFQKRYPETGLSTQIQIQKEKEQFEEIKNKQGGKENMEVIKEIPTRIEKLINDASKKLESEKGVNLMEYYFALGKAYSLLAEIKNELKEDVEQTYKLAADNFYLGSEVGQNHAFIVLVDATKASSGAPTPYYQSKLSIAPSLVVHKKNLLYSSSADSYRKAGYNKHADWMEEGGEFKGFDINEVKK